MKSSMLENLLAWFGWGIIRNRQKTQKAYNLFMFNGKLYKLKKLKNYIEDRIIL